MNRLTHWSRVTHICISKVNIIGSDNGLSPERHQAIIWTNAGILLIGPSGTIVGEILIDIRTFPFKKMHLKMSSGKWRPFCLGLNVLMHCGIVTLCGVVVGCYHWFKQWHVACSTPRHHLNKPWFIIGKLDLQQYIPVIFEWPISASGTFYLPRIAKAASGLWYG